MSSAEQPQFAHAVRGYDRQQVADYVTTLNGYLDEMTQRALAAESLVASMRAEVEEEPPAGTRPRGFRDLGPQRPRTLPLTDGSALARLPRMQEGARAAA